MDPEKLDNPDDRRSIDVEDRRNRNSGRFFVPPTCFMPMR